MTAALPIGMLKISLRLDIIMLCRGGTLGRQYDEDTVAKACGFKDWGDLLRAHDKEVDASDPISEKLKLLLGEHGPTIFKMLLIKAGND